MRLLDFLRLILEQFVSEHPHFADVIAELEGALVLARPEVQFDFVQVDEFALEFIELGVVRI